MFPAFNIYDHGQKAQARCVWKKPGVRFLNVDLRALLRVLATYPWQLVASEKLGVISHQFHKKVAKGLVSTYNSA